MSEIKNSKLAARLPLIVAIAVVAGIFVGARMLEPNMDTESLSGNLTKFREVLTSIDQNYVDDVASDELVERAIREMLDHLDPHSRYIPADKVAQMNAQLKGHYDGIGVQFVILQDTVYVVKAMEGGPSRTLGIQTGDRIIRVEDESLIGINLESQGVADRLLGPSGTEVNVTVLRDQEELVFTIKRGKIPQRSVEGYLVRGDIGYIKISNFGDRTYQEFRQTMEQLIEEGMEKLILDLQGNPGGRMDAAERISDELISGKRLLVSQRSAHKQYNTSTYARKTGLFEDQPVIVLVDENSASASEIVSGALQDHDRALIVGRRTYGKGLVQLPITLADNSEMMLTIARYYTPSGRCIQKPYDDSEAYFHDLNERYDHGEMFYQDSIKFVDSLRFTTAKGRVVYGGGGIMPDHFIPFDTASYTRSYRRVVSTGILRKYALDYFTSHRESMQYLDLEGFVNTFELDAGILDDIKSIAGRFDVTIDDDELAISETLIRTSIKADLADFLWGEAGYYRVTNPVTNEIYVQALDMFDEATLLARAYNQ